MEGGRVERGRGKREEGGRDNTYVCTHKHVHVYIHVYNVCIYIVPPGPHRLSPEGGQSASWPDLERVLEARYISDEGGREGGREGRREGGKEGG